MQLLALLHASLSRELGESESDTESAGLIEETRAFADGSEAVIFRQIEQALKHGNRERAREHVNELRVKWASPPSEGSPITNAPTPTP